MPQTKIVVGCEQLIPLLQLHSCVELGEAALVVAGAGDGPFAVSVEPPVGVDGMNQSAASATPVGRARSARAKRPHAVVPTVAASLKDEAAPLPIVPVPVLTPREAHLLAALAADPAASSATLGAGRGIAAGTVRKALGALREKLGAGPDADGATLVALARARGLLAGTDATGTA
jgi:DNA-binding CsgD family transcriptional regulator